jgi:hypothetical protein
MSSEIAALSELKGRCLAIKVVWLDTGYRMEVADQRLTKFLNDAVKRPLLPEEVQELGEEIMSIRSYLKEVRDKYPEVRGEFDPTIRVCDWLVAPIK